MAVFLVVLLLLSEAQSNESLILEQKTASPGGSVTLTCERKAINNLYWTRLVPDQFPEVFYKSTVDDLRNSRIRAEKVKNKLFLRLNEVTKQDTAVYICVEVLAESWTLINGTNLTVAAPPVVGVRPSPPSGSPGPSETLHPSDRNTALEDFTSCFPPGKFPSASVYTEGNHEYECGDEREGQSSSTCVYRFFMNTSLADGGSCSVTSCGERSDRGAAGCHCVISLSIMAAVLTVSLAVIMFLLRSNRKLKSARTRLGSDQQQQDDSVTYASPIHSKTKSGEKKSVDTRKEECVYSRVQPKY